MSTSDVRQGVPDRAPASEQGSVVGGVAWVGEKPDRHARTPAAVEIALLGDVRLSCVSSHGPVAVTISNTKARLVFALLATQPGTAVSRERLADELWPDRVPESWGAALRNVISRVRTSLRTAFGDAGEDMLASVKGAYVLQLPGHVILDVDDAQEQLVSAHDCLLAGDAQRAVTLARSAVDALRQPLLAEHYGNWVNDFRDRLTEQLVVGLETLSRASLLRGNETDGLSAASRAVQLAPLRESAYRCLMAAHAAAGNRAEALRSYQRLRVVLCDEMGVDPDPETEAAYLNLLGVAPANRHRPPASDAADRVVRFYGRDAEMEQVSEIWRAVCGQGVRTLLLTGEAGVGKTRLAVEFAYRATAEGAMVLFAQGRYDSDECDKVMVDLLEPILSLSDADGGLPADTELLAMMRRRPNESERRTLYGMVQQRMATLAEQRPLVVVLDDMQWADTESVQLYRHLAQSLRASKVLFVVITRDHLPTKHALHAPIESARSAGMLTHVRLTGLALEPSESIARDLTDEPDILGDLRSIHATAAGNPFLLVEAVRARIAGAGPDWPLDGEPTFALDSFVSAMTQPLSPSGLRLIEVASLFAGTLNHITLGGAAGLSSRELIDAADEACRAGMMMEVSSAAGESRYRFVHEIVRRTVYRRLGRSRRLQLHELAADALDALSGGSVDTLDEIAYHRCAGALPGGDVRAVRSALASAEFAHSTGSTRQTEYWCRQALRHVSTGDQELQTEVLTLLGKAMIECDSAAATELLFDCTMTSLRIGRLDLATQAAIELGRASVDSSEPLREARLAVASVLTQDCTSVLRLPGAGRSNWAQLVSISLQLDSRSCTPTQAATALSILRADLDSHMSILELSLRQAIATDLRVVARALGDSRAELQALHHQSMVAAYEGNITQVERGLADIRMLDAVEDGLGASALVRDYDFAVQSSKGLQPDLIAVDAGDDVTHAQQPDYRRRQLIINKWLMGTLARCDRAPAGNPVDEAVVDACSGSVDEAVALAHDLIGGQHHGAEPDTWLHDMACLSIVAVEAGDHVLARHLYALIEPYAPLASGIGFRTYTGTVSFHLGRLAASLGWWAAAERHLGASARAFVTQGAHPWASAAVHALSESSGRREHSRGIDPYDAREGVIPRRFGTPHLMASAAF